MSDVTVITGGSRGIGAACVKLAVEAGHTVCFSYVSDKNAADKIVEAASVIGGNVTAVRADVGNEADIIRLFGEADKIGQLTCLINNAGIIDKTKRVEEYTAERLNRIFNVNVIGSILCAREAVKRMSTKQGGKGGSIVNLSSAAAYLGSPNQYVDYASSKAAIDTFTKGLALEVADEGVRVNAVRPGVIDTDIHQSAGEIDRVKQIAHLIPMKRGGSAKEVAKAILWLASDDASYVTGECLNVTGGR